MYKGCHIVKGESHLESAVISESLGAVQRKYQHEKFEVTVLKMCENRLLYIDKQADEASHKSYYMTSGKCMVLDSNELLLPGDIIVCHQLQDVLTLQAIEQSEILIVTTNYSSYETIKKSNLKLDQLLNEIQEKDHYTKLHCENVHALTKKMAIALGYTSERLYAITKAAMYHDIGKIYIEDEILNKNGPLNSEEYAYIKSHVIKGESLILSNYNDYIYKIISQHHERLNGTGYPNALMEDEIMEEAKIIAICDSYDAMTSDRVYHKGKSKEQALSELKSEAGNLYDEKLVNKFIELIE